MHLGLIPDGNRRWCRMAGTGIGFLAALHVRRIAAMYSNSLSLPPELAGVRELSVYMLSIDNLTKRQDETVGMVMRVLQCMHVLLALTPPALMPCRAAVREGREVGTATLSVSRQAWASATGGSPDVPCDEDLAAIIDGTLSLHEILIDAEVRAELPEAWLEALDRYSGRSEKEKGLSLQVRFSDAPESTLECCDTPGTAEALQQVLDGLAHARRGVRAEFVGEVDMLPERARAAVAAIERLSACPAPWLTVRFALAYDPVRDMVRRAPDPGLRRDIDLVIRTSGEQRSSGFFALDTLYSEWAYLPMLFPDLGADDVATAVREFRARQRRFGA